MIARAMRALHIRLIPDTHQGAAGKETNTPAHVIFAAAAFAQPYNRRRTFAAVAGAQAPDLSLYVMAATALYVLRLPPYYVFESPLSYWDNAAHAGLIAPIEMSLSLLFCAVLMRRFPSWRSRFLIGCQTLVQLAPVFFWAFVFAQNVG